MNDLNEYQREAMEFRLDSATTEYALFGLAGEVGEIQGYVAKSIRDGYEIDIKHMKKELGDVLWFVAALANDLGLTLATVADGNIAKLSRRQLLGTIQGSGDDR
jgi:NTP pyrophosphatase (non-canonical NTP hydrolase)